MATPFSVQRLFQRLCFDLKSTVFQYLLHEELLTSRFISKDVIVAVDAALASRPVIIWASRGKKGQKGTRFPPYTQQAQCLEIYAQDLETDDDAIPTENLVFVLSTPRHLMQATFHFPIAVSSARALAQVYEMLAVPTQARRMAMCWNFWLRGSVQECARLSADYPFIHILGYDAANRRCSDLNSLVESDQFRELQLLDFSNGVFCDDNVAKLAQSAHVSRLTTLKLRNSHLDAESLMQIMTSPNFANLTDLDLGWAFPWRFPAALQALAEASFFTKLECLNLADNPLDSQALTTFIRQTRSASRLSDLNLGGNSLSFAAVTALVESASRTSLTRLSLRGAELGAKGVRALLTSPHLKNLVELSIQANGIEREGAKYLSQLLKMPKLRSLNLAKNGLGCDGAEALASGNRLMRITQLDLSNNKLGPYGLQAILNSPGLRRVSDLDVSLNGLGEMGASMLAESEFSRHLLTLTANRNEFGRNATSVFAASPHFKNLKRLCLQHNAMGKMALFGLAKSKSLTALEHLDLSGNDAEETEELSKFMAIVFPRLDRCLL